MDVHLNLVARSMKTTILCFSLEPGGCHSLTSKPTTSQAAGSRRIEAGGIFPLLSPPNFKAAQSSHRRS